MRLVPRLVVSQTPQIGGGLIPLRQSGTAGWDKRFRPDYGRPSVAILQHRGATSRRVGEDELKQRLRRQPARVRPRPGILAFHASCHEQRSDGARFAGNRVARRQVRAHRSRGADARPEKVQEPDKHRGNRNCQVLSGPQVQRFLRNTQVAPYDVCGAEARNKHKRLWCTAHARSPVIRHKCRRTAHRVLRRPTGCQDVTLRHS
mmetsp:Transcript_45843/g.141214  ORF Transcript_45843/g.141214 Transcript_45843/m.141214 type:complete len:204 (+) Transcript_45843:121-732(+)